MSIINIKGNLLDFPAGCTAIAHCCNTKNIFGGGIAKQIKEEYPVAYEADCIAAKEGYNKLGNVSVAEIVNGKRIINVYGQQNYGTEKRQLDYEAFYVAFELIRNKFEQAHKEGRTRVLGVPKFIGCGLAGGEWSIIEAMFKYLFEASPVQLVIVEYNKKP
jgi:O-acetyl-ADP-ribose deacetylase (regulator of RNase III)